MNSGKYTLKSFLTDHNLDQIIIPEIQRDYVWKRSNVESLLTSIKENSERSTKISSSVTQELIDKLPVEMRDKMLRELESTKSYCNVGFIYAYFDSEYPGRLMLIDGQQRLTTLFLLLLALHIKEDKSQEFYRAYFRDGLLKVDYKVREATHDFLTKFTEHILFGKSFDSVTDQYWYFSEYNEDVTIQSIITNYNTIDLYISKNDISLDYIENYIEFFYFDTNKSKQGEELYIYMNSRGESVSAGESIKAGLLKGLSDNDKNIWGSKWEEWQSFFWKNSKDYASADAGMEEFLRWVKILEYIENYNDKVTERAIKIKEIKEGGKLSIEGLELERIEYYYIGLKNLYDYKAECNLEDKWLWGQTTAVDYLKFIPALIFASNYPNCEPDEIQRFYRFFFNTSRFDSLNKNPYSSLIDIVNLSKSFCDKGFTDIVQLPNLAGENFKNILTHEEILKLTIYSKAQDSFRKDIEAAFWEAEDYKVFDGKITFLFSCLTNDLKELDQHFDQLKLSEFENIYENFISLFDKLNDKVRRALLILGDYKIHDGRTSSLNGDRYSFISEDWRFKGSFNNKDRQDIYKSFIRKFSQLANENVEMTMDDILDLMIHEYSNSDEHEKNWRYYFITEPSVLEYCRSKYVCFKSSELSDIYLLQGMYAKEDTYVSLTDFIKDNTNKPIPHNV